MNWLRYTEELREGRTIKIRPRGNSMTPRIKSNQLLTIIPDISSIEVNDIVFCKVNGNYYIHLVTAIQSGRYQISNNRGYVNGWTSKIFGKVVDISD